VLRPLAQDRVASGFFEREAAWRHLSIGLNINKDIAMTLNNRTDRLDALMAAHGTLRGAKQGYQAGALTHAARGDPLSELIAAARDNAKPEQGAAALPHGAWGDPLSELMSAHHDCTSKSHQPTAAASPSSAWGDSLEDLMMASRTGQILS
jgi:hypothetical protein